MHLGANAIPTDKRVEKISVNKFKTISTQVAGAWSEREKMFHGGSFLKLADDDVQIENPEAQNREVSGF